MDGYFPQEGLELSGGAVGGHRFNNWHPEVLEGPQAKDGGIGLCLKP